MSKPLISAQSISVRARTHTIFEKLDFEWTAGQHWAIIGPNGSGKSAFLQTLIGKLLVSRGEILRPFATPYLQSEVQLNEFFSYHNLMQLVDIRHDFRNRSNLKEFYYQQRYNAHDADRARTVVEHLAEHVTPTIRPTYWDIEKVRHRLGLEKLWNKSLIKLSNGETKRVRLATALLHNPLILLLDNVFAGLDPTTRTYFEEVFKEIVAHGTHIAFVTTPDEIPAVVTDVLVLDNCRIHLHRSVKDFYPETDYPAQPINIDYKTLEALITEKPIPTFESIVKIQNATVKYGQEVLLDNVSWNINQGDRWALSGSNGSGKSTLLSLLNGDHPQAYACNLHLFGKKRGSGESIWDIKSNIGFMSPELYQYFPTQSSCTQVVISGFYDTLNTYHKGTASQIIKARKWLDLLDLVQEKDAPLSGLPASKQRLCLLARTLVKVPAFLILDEPCQGLDHVHQEKFREIIDTVARLTNITLVYVTHYREQLPKCIDKEMTLNG